MIDERRYLDALIQRQQDMAVNSVGSPPSERTLFDYGVGCGVFKGLSIAIELLKEQLRDAKEKDL